MSNRNSAEQIFRGFIRRPLLVEIRSAANQFAGFTTLASGSATQVVSTSAISSGDLVFTGFMGPSDTASGTGRMIEVKSIDSGNAFHFGTADGLTIPRDTHIMWMIFKT